MRVKIIATGQVREVTPNVAHDLIDSGKARRYTESTVRGYERAVVSPRESRRARRARRAKRYANRQLRPSRKASR